MQYLTRRYRELLRQYGLVPVMGDIEEVPRVAEGLCTSAGSGHKIVDMPEFGTWEDVVASAEKFIRTLYCEGRIAAILEGRKVGAREVRAMPGGLVSGTAWAGPDVQPVAFAERVK
jgi:hypothetical protein